MRVSLKDYCIEHGLDHLLKEWDAEKNLPDTPDTVPYGGHKKVWWKCEKGHEWEATIYSRTEGNLCPYCSGRKVLIGVTDLLTTHPDLAAEWHPTKNGKLMPEQVSAGSNRKVWWKCNEGHEWQTQVKTRSRGTGCPICANRVAWRGYNDLATKYPEIAAEWHPTMNGPLSPSDVVYCSEKKVWWKCDKGHEWQAKISKRTIGQDCPYCTNRLVMPGYNDLTTLYPEVAKWWHPTKNGNLTPAQVVPGCNKKVWWTCEHGHEYEAIVNSRIQHTVGCPYCTNRKVWPGFNDLATVDPEIAKEWHPTKNGDLTPKDVTRGSKKKVWWRCNQGHEWQARIYSRTSLRTGCPKCYKGED